MHGVCSTACVLADERYRDVHGSFAHGLEGVAERRTLAEHR
jgi:hypothetical protein